MNDFYNPNSNYGNTNGNWSTTAFIGNQSGWLEDNQPIAFNRFASGFSSSDNPFGAWVRAQLANAQTGYKSAWATNPQLTFQKYLEDLGPGFFQQRYGAMAPSLRGISQAGYGGGRTQWFG